MMPRLLIVLPHIGNAGGGVSEAARVLTYALFNQQEFDIHVLTLDTPQDRDSTKNWPDINFHFYSSLGPENYGFSIGMTLHMLNNKYDVIHVHGVWTYHVAAAGLGLFKGTPLIISPHGMLEPWILKRSPHLKGAVMKLYQEKIFLKSSYFHALTNKEQKDIKKLLPDCKIVTIPNFVQDVDKSLVDKPSWYNKNHDKKGIFLFFGRIHDKKGWRPLINAWINLCNNDNEFKNNNVLVFCGWNDGIADFENIIQQANLKTNNVLYAGPQFGDDRTNSYQAADYFILPSKSEGLPMAVLEAVKNENLIMMSRACNLSEMIDGYAAIDTGEDEDSILLALQSVYRMDQKDISAIKSNALKYVNENFSENIVVNKMLFILKKIMFKRGENSE